MQRPCTARLDAAENDDQQEARRTLAHLTDDLLPYEDEIRSVEGPDASMGRATEGIAP